MDRFRRWASLKANAILNTLEILFWFVVVIVTLMGISKYCKGVNCGMGWIMVIVATALTYVGSLPHHSHRLTWPQHFRHVDVRGVDPDISQLKEGKGHQ